MLLDKLQQRTSIIPTQCAPDTASCQLAAGGGKAVGGASMKAVPPHKAISSTAVSSLLQLNLPCPAAMHTPARLRPQPHPCSTQTTTTPICQPLAPRIMQHDSSLCTLMTGKVHHVLSEFRQCGGRRYQHIRTKSLTWHSINRQQ